MNKPLCFCFIAFLIFNSSCFAQISPPPADTMRVIEIIDGKFMRQKSIDSVNNLETISGNVLLRERSTKFSCDSAIINRKENTLEAFGNVHINDADSLHTYSQYLKYFGNQRLAHLTKDVKLTDNKGILLTQDLQYDLGAGIGTYHTGGKVINGSTVLTSKDGVYYANTKDVYFRNNVDLVDPKYKIQADSLLYNTQTQKATFIGPTNIKSKDAIIFTTQGWYDLKNGNAFFGTRSLVTDSSHRIYQADSMAIDDNAGLAELVGRAVIKDSANGIIVTANHIYLNNKNSSFLAVTKPVMIIQQEKDSIYIAADTLFSGFTGKPAEKAFTEKDDSIQKDQSGEKYMAAHSMSLEALRQTTQAKPDTTVPPHVADTANALLPVKSRQSDSLHADSLKRSKPVNKADRPGKPASDKANPDSVKQQISKNILPADSIKKTRVVDLAKTDSTGSGGVVGLMSPDSARQHLSKNALPADTSKRTGVVNLNKADSAIRYFLAFHHVRIYNDSLQSVCDSLFFSAEDSVFRLFRQPVVWSGQSQVTGDTIYLYTKNKKPEHFYVFNNGMIINKSHNDFYNQVAGKTINGYFKDGSIDYARVKGQKAESIYYVQDNDSAYVGMNNSTGDVIDMFFLNKELNKVKFINDVKGTMYPMKQIPDDKKFLKNFNWLDKRRPKNKLELFE